MAGTKEDGKERRTDGTLVPILHPSVTRICSRERTAVEVPAGGEEEPWRLVKGDRERTPRMRVTACLEHDEGGGGGVKQALGAFNTPPPPRGLGR